MSAEKAFVQQLLELCQAYLKDSKTGAKVEEVIREKTGRGPDYADDYYTKPKYQPEPRVTAQEPFYGPPANMRDRHGCKEATGWPQAFKSWAHKAMRSLQRGNVRKPLRNKDIADEINRLRNEEGLDDYAHIYIRVSNELAQGNGKYWDKVNHGCWIPRNLPGE